MVRRIAMMLLEAVIRTRSALAAAVTTGADLGTLAGWSVCANVRSAVSASIAVSSRVFNDFGLSIAVNMSNLLMFLALMILPPESHSYAWVASLLVPPRPTRYQDGGGAAGVVVEQLQRRDDRAAHTIFSCSPYRGQL